MRTRQINLFQKQPLGLTLIVELAANEHEHEEKNLSWNCYRFALEIMVNKDIRCYVAICYKVGYGFLKESPIRFH